MSDPAAAPCAVASLARTEPLLGTASRVRRWLLVEQPGPWGEDALLESRLDEGVARVVEANSRRHGVRVVLIRRPGWQASERSSVFLARTDPSHSWLEQLELDDPDELAALDLSVLTADRAPGIGRLGPAGGVHLVCTNGRHDRCCADFGRPVIRALQAAGAADVWECTHIGGDRFAANIVSFPSGVYLGRVPPEEAVAMLADLANGIVALDHYRGRSCYPPLVQVAEISARRHLGASRLGALTVVSTAYRGPDEVQVVLDAGPEGGRMVVQVARTLGDLDQLTCAGGPPARPWRYELLSLRPA